MSSSLQAYIFALLLSLSSLGFGAESEGLKNLEHAQHLELAQPKGSKSLLKFGVIADMQFYDPLKYGNKAVKGKASDRRSRHYLKTPDRLREAIGKFKKHHTAFAFNLGDLIDRGFESYDIPLEIMEESDLEWHHVLGNHEYSVEDEEKPLVLGRLGMPAPYYQFVAESANMRFVVLNANEYSTLAFPKDTERYEESKALKKMFKAKYKKSGADDPWCVPEGISGALGASQLEFLRGALEEAELLNQQVLIMSHQPADWIWDYHALMDTVRPFRKNIIAFMSGHLHTGDEDILEGIPSISLKAMFESPENAFTIGKVYANRLELHEYGRQKFEGKKSLTLYFSPNVSSATQHP